MNEDKKKQLIRRYMRIRENLLRESPFYGNLVMHLKFGLADCETAYTNMRHIVFDPEFMERLSDEELKFVVVHEVLHCVLLHCVRGTTLNHLVYNIACDIVVNSNILYGMQVEEFEVDGSKVMHRAPDGQEGYLYTAEQVYDMLWDHVKSIDIIAEEFGNSLDNHDIWKTILDAAVLQDQWQKSLLEAGGYSTIGCPPSARGMLLDLLKPSRLNWRELLNDFIQVHNDNFDYTFVPPDKRFLDYDFFLPSFQEFQEEHLEDLWFCIDTSGSIDDATLQMVYSEIGHAIMQTGNLRGMLSFFDTEVTEPVNFSTVEDVKEIQPLGGGGTSFWAIFNYMKNEMRENKPKAIIILTDGYAEIPDESAAEGVPVLWVLTRPEIVIDWGTVIYIA